MVVACDSWAAAGVCHGGGRGSEGGAPAVRGVCSLAAAPGNKPGLPGALLAAGAWARAGTRPGWAVRPGGAGVCQGGPGHAAAHGTAALVLPNWAGGGK